MIEIEMDVLRPVPTLVLSPDSIVPPALIEKLKIVTKEHSKILKKQTTAALAISGVEWGRRKWFDEDLNITVQGDFMDRLAQVLRVMYPKRDVRYIRHYWNAEIFSQLLDQQYYYDVHGDMDWDKGEYRDSGSCWFDYEDVSVFRMKFRHMCYKGEAFTMRFYDKDRRPYGRCFGFFLPDGKPVLFNPYGGSYDRLYAIMVAAGRDAFKVQETAKIRYLRLGHDDHISNINCVFGTSKDIPEYRNLNWSDYVRFSNEKLEEERLTYFKTHTCKKCGKPYVAYSICERCEGVEYP